MKLILASNSKWRKKIINDAGLKCETLVSDVDENIEFVTPEEYVITLSKMKANAVSSKINEGIIIAADTIGYMDNEKFEKPKDRTEAFENLKKLSGRVNYAVTGVTILDKQTNGKVSFSDTAAVYFKEMSDDEINWYIDNEKGVYQCAGYSIETCGALFIEKIEGNYSNIVGLPISRIYDELKKMGYKITDFETI